MWNSDFQYKVPNTSWAPNKHGPLSLFPTEQGEPGRKVQRCGVH